MEFSAWILSSRNYFLLRTFLLSNVILASNGFAYPSLVSTCDTFGTCSQKCDMISGQAKCSCVEMFQLNNDNKTCTPNDPFKQLIYSTSHAIYSIRGNMDDFTNSPQQNQILNMTEEIFRYLTNDVRNNYVYGTNLAGNYEGVFRINLTQSQSVKPEIVVDAGTYMPEGIAFDWITGNVYFVDSQWSYIAVCTPRLTQCAIILEETTSRTTSFLSAIALHPNAGIMFWADKGATEVIRKAGMDGSNPITIVSTNLMLPYGITVDEAASRIYWAEGAIEVIETTRFDGSDRRQIASSPFPMAIDLFDDIIYWADWSDDEIKSINKFGGSKSTISTKENPRGLTIMHISKQPKLRTNHCENLQCSHICVLSPTNAHCLCPVGMIRNGTECFDAETSPKLLLAQGNILLITRVNAIGRDIFEQVHIPWQIKAITALVYNPINNSVIISDDISKNIVEYKIGSQVYLILVQTDLINVTCLEMDAVGENLFWYDAGKSTLEVMSMKTKARAIIMSNIQNIHDILFVRHHSALYISQLGTSGLQVDIRKIIFSNDQHVNVTSVYEFWDEVKLVQLAYDSNANKVLGVFWNASHVNVQSINPGVAYNSMSNHSIFDAVQINNQMYWVDTTNKVKVRTTLGVYNSFLQTIKINIHPPRMNNSSSLPRKILAAMETSSGLLGRSRITHPCSPVNVNRKACSHICLPTENRSVGACWCPSHLQLGVDGLTCTDQRSGTKAHEQDMSEGESQMKSQSANITDAFEVVNTTIKHSYLGESKSGSSASVTVYITVPICLIIIIIIVAVVIYVIVKRERNGASLLPKPFNSYDIM